jgi:hypothetical protein
MALEQLTGAGGGLQSNQQAINHFNYLTNHAALAEKNLRNQAEQAYSLSKQKMPADFWDKVNANLPGSPMDAVDPVTIGKNLYGDNSAPSPAAAVAPTGGIKLRSGLVAVPVNP